MTRAFPMQEVEYEAKSQRDHYHHRGMTFGHDNVGGWDTWSEAGSYGPPPADPDSRWLKTHTDSVSA